MRLSPQDALREIGHYLQNLQDTICLGLEQVDAARVFQEHRWEHTAGGGGRSRVLVEGGIFERAGVNFSHVKGVSLPSSATEQRPDLKGACFQALGISLVLHPQNPFIPTVHANLRFIITDGHTHTPVWWFGGGYDLTPYYGFDEDCQHWHGTARAACAPFGENVYPRYKKWCDEYFFIKHRQEARGIGGLFFDDVNESTFGGGFEQCFAFIQSVGDSFLPAYLPIVLRRQDHIYDARHRQFQLYRRGRYVEFNLIYDRGTLFGLQSGGRAESILVSLPPLVRWESDWKPEPGSEEEKLYTHYLPAQDWI